MTIGQLRNSRVTQLRLCYKIVCIISIYAIRALNRSTTPVLLQPFHNDNETGVPG